MSGGLPAPDGMPAMSSTASAATRSRGLSAAQCSLPGGQGLDLLVVCAMQLFSSFSPFPALASQSHKLDDIVRCITQVTSSLFSRVRSSVQHFH